jgi:hypothetical protein
MAVWQTVMPSNAQKKENSNKETSEYCTLTRNCSAIFNHYPCVYFCVITQMTGIFKIQQHITVLPTVSKATHFSTVLN